MELITCPGCDTSISVQSQVCPNCGRSLTSRPKSKAGCVACGAMLLIVIAFALIAVMRYIPDVVSKLRPAPSQTPAEKARQTAITEGVPVDSRRDVEMRMQDVEAKMKRDVAVQIRRQLAEQLGAKLDANVLVLGIDADRIRLRSDRVDAAWAEEFRKSEEARELREAGFTRVELRGAHGYRQNWEWGGMQVH